MTGILGGGGFLKDQVAWRIFRGKWKGFSHKMLEDDEDDTVDGSEIRLTTWDGAKTRRK